MLFANNNNFFGNFNSGDALEEVPDDINVNTKVRLMIYFLLLLLLLLFNVLFFKKFDFDSLAVPAFCQLSYQTNFKSRQIVAAPGRGLFFLFSVFFHGVFSLLMPTLSFLFLPFFCLKNVSFRKNHIKKIQGFDKLTVFQTPPRRPTRHSSFFVHFDRVVTSQALLALDLYDNQISAIENLDCCTQLTSVRHPKHSVSLCSLTVSTLRYLDLSFNVIKRIEYISGLAQLEKLFLIGTRESLAGQSTRAHPHPHL